MGWPGRLLSSHTSWSRSSLGRSGTKEPLFPLVAVETHTTCAQLTCVLFPETAPEAGGEPAPQTRPSLPDGAAAAEAPRGHQALVLQPGAADGVQTRREREGPDAETPEVWGRKPEGSASLAPPSAAPAAVLASTDSLSSPLQADAQKDIKPNLKQYHLPTIERKGGGTEQHVQLTLEHQRGLGPPGLASRAPASAVHTPAARRPGAASPRSSRRQPDCMFALIHV